MESVKNISYFKGKKETKIDLEYLKNEMAQFLQLDNLNILLGAGCSSHIVDGKEQGIPGMANLYKGFFEDNPGFAIGEVEAEPLFDGNLEKMLETMGAVSIAEKVKPIDTDIENKISTVQKYIRRRVIDGLH